MINVDDLISEEVYRKMDVVDERRHKNKCSWWRQRSKVEKCSVLVISLCLLLILYLASNLFMKFPPQNGAIKGDVCMTEKCIQASAHILEKIDHKIQPCDDFYKFACGNFLKKAIIPEEKISINPFNALRDKVGDQLKTIFEAPNYENDPHSLQLIKTIYKACINITKVENESVSFVKKAFKELGGWPVIETTYWNERTFDWKRLLYRLRKSGWRYNYFFNVYVGVDMTNSSRRILTISQPCIAYDRLKKGANDTAVKAYHNYLTELAVLFGADRVHASAEMHEVVDFEIAFAKLIIPYEQTANWSLFYNLRTVKELQTEFPSIPWVQYLNSFLASVEVVYREDVVVVTHPEFMQNMENLLSQTKKRVLANYMFNALVKSVVGNLPEAFRKQELEYQKVLYGKTQSTPRWKKCISDAMSLDVAIGSIYIKHFFNKVSKRKITELVLDIKSAFYEALKNTGWMDKKTKKHALSKAEKMNTWIAYPEELLEDEKVEGLYREMEINPSRNYLEIDANLSLQHHLGHIKKLREPVVRPDWESQAGLVFYANAFYSENENAIELPAAILQGNFFDPDRPQYLNYGAIGSIIGHEITHGFDNHGRQYDKDGNLLDWWEPETNRTFDRKSQCLVEQYGNCTVPEIEMNLNGVKTLAENIADNGGIKMAYRGYLKWLERNKGEYKLPGLKYTPRQMFWISSATGWCSKYKKEALTQKVTSGVHSPDYFRVNIPFMNSDHFARDFNCPLGTPMNPKFKCRVW